MSDGASHHDEKESATHASESAPSDVKIDLEQLGEQEGYILETEGADEGLRLRTAADGKTVLIPQPSDDPNDPLNWSATKKHIILFVVSATALLPDYGSATGAVTLIPQAAEFGISPNTVNHSQAGNVFMLGAGGILVIVLSGYFGRLPVLFWFTLLGFGTAIWCAAAESFASFFAARILNGFFSTVAQAGGLMFVKDMFFFHEHARKINIWDGFVILSPYLGPFVTALVISRVIWRWGFWIFTILTGVCLFGIIVFGEETFYNRKIPRDQQPERGSRLAQLVGIAQWRTRRSRNSFKEAVMRPVKVILKPVVFLSSIYYFATFGWVVGINTTLALFVTPLYGFGPIQIGLFYFTPMIAVVLGQIAGHWLHDAIARYYTHKHHGRFEPEARLMAIWFSTPFMITGLVVIGFALQKPFPAAVLGVGWGLFVFGIMITTVALQAYVLGCYPEGSGEVAGWLNFARSMGGFAVSYFQIVWADAVGTESSFGTQAALCFAAFLFIPFMQWKGKAMRRWAGPLNFNTQ